MTYTNEEDESVYAIKSKICFVKRQSRYCTCMPFQIKLFELLLLILLCSISIIVIVVVVLILRLKTRMKRIPHVK